MSAAPRRPDWWERLISFFAVIKRSGPFGIKVYEFVSRVYWTTKIAATRHRSDEEHIRKEFRACVGRDLDLGNPRTFSEKLQYLKLHDQTALHRQCADKIAVRDYVSQRLPADALIPVIMTTRDVDDIRPEKIPNERFVIKTNHDSGSVQFCHDRSTFDWDACRRKLRRALRRDFWLIGRELQYRDIDRALIVEEMLQSEVHCLRDYKFYCFAGDPKFLQVDIDRFSNHRRDLFDLSWNRLDAEYCIPRSDIAVPRPDALPTMIDYARRLSAPFRFARIDLFLVGDHVYFGEVTFHPYSGFREFTPQSFERRLGDMIVLE